MGSELHEPRCRYSESRDSCAWNKKKTRTKFFIKKTSIIMNRSIARFQFTESNSITFSNAQCRYADMHNHLYTLYNSIRISPSIYGYLYTRKRYHSRVQFGKLPPLGIRSNLGPGSPAHEFSNREPLENTKQLRPPPFCIARRDCCTPQ